MSQPVQFMLEDGTSVVVAALPRAGSSPVGFTDHAAKAAKKFRESLEPVTAAAQEAMENFRHMARGPEEVEITFGVSFDATLGAIMASADAGATLEVRLHWTNVAPPSTEEGTG